ncbi:PspC domain-containing protein [Paenibacillus harenae]|uniref:Phage shock protein PspC (Stress-responsive transcriptional regulator) n=1 Tax=Paenibacillus harenae TaxID=306543 RepID=A0ABT9TV32_PAEHA|nr:PspC domain-containing protein [Paenibacillus harenae]MDQ0111225.1 phage shock protein PspC (stress-responsive transcriptional regulator) [Paenibacillus harenae]
MKKLYRLRQEKMLFGLCGGIARMLNVDATLLRILLVVVTILSGGAPILVYLIAALVVPKEPPIYSDYGPHGFNNGFGGGFHPGGYNQGGYNNGFGGNANGNGQFGTPPSYGGPYKNPPQQSGAWNDPQHNAAPASGSQFDSMMDDLEKKALRREIDELKAKLAQYEKGE